MKHFKTLTLLALVTITALSCIEGPPNVSEEDPVVEAPGFIIAIEDADTLFKDYGTERGDLLEGIEQEIDPETKYKATRFVTVNFDEMQQYLNFIQQQSDSAGIKPQGLRFYFGKYSNKNNPKKNGAETVFINPTANFNGVKGEISYAIATDATGKKTAVTVGSVIDGTKSPAGTNLTLQGGETQSLAANRGTMPPPPHAGDPNDYH